MGCNGILINNINGLSVFGFFLAELEPRILQIFHHQKSVSYGSSMGILWRSGQYPSLGEMSQRVIDCGLVCW